MSARAHSRQRSSSNQISIQPLTYLSKGKENANDGPFEPCAATGSLFLYAEGSSVICLHHDTLALERRFEKHTENIQFICVDNVSERGQGRLVVTYDVGHTAIVWDLMSGEQVSRFASYEPLTAAAWMRNGNLTFGNEKGELILFEPATSEHVSARTIFDPVTAIAPSSDCKTFALGYRNGSILLASLQPAFTILHTLSTSRAPSQITALSWHASSSKQKSDMLATNTIDGDLRVWSVAKPPGSTQPRVIRSLHRSEAFAPSKSWITWSKNGRILQLYEGITWAWDVRTKDVTYQPIPTVEYIRGIAAYGPTGTLFTLGPDHTVQQYDIEQPQMVANVRHVPQGVPQTPPPMTFPHAVNSETESDFHSPQKENGFGTGTTSANNRVGTSRSAHRRSDSLGLQNVELRANETRSPAAKTERTTTTISMGTQSISLVQPQSPTSTKSARKSSRLRQEVIMSPQEKPILDLLPFTRARLSDVPYYHSNSIDESNLTPDSLRQEMLRVVFGWKDDIRSLLNDEVGRHPANTPNAIYLSRWLGNDPNQVSDMFRSAASDVTLDWMRLALNSIGNQPGARNMAQVFTQKLLTHGDVHAAACLLLAIGDYNDAIEVYVSRGFHMEAILLTCLVMPSDWQRQSHLVRRWGEHVVQFPQQQHLAVRCFSCTNAEPTEPWSSPIAQAATQALNNPVTMLQPNIFHKTMERRGVQEASPQAGLASPVHFPASLAGRVGQTPGEGGLKLITSFGSKDDFKFPGLLSEEGTPINAAFATPIAESAFPRSALSPVAGFSSQRMNNMRSLTGALASKTGTPTTHHRIRLPSIGETPIDAELPQFSSSIIPRAPPTPADSGSDKEKEKGKSSQSLQDKKAAQQPLPMLLTQARYEPTEPVGHVTPQTVVIPKSTMSFGSGRRLSMDGPTSARPRGSSHTRKPDGLSVQTSLGQDSQPDQEFLKPMVYGASIQRPATTTAVFATSRTEISPPNTGNSFSSLKSAKSPVGPSGRSLDQYISSLEQAQYYKTSRSRGDSLTSRQSKDESGERRYKQLMQDATNIGRARSASNSIPIPPPKSSPSSPVPMSSEEIRMYTASFESLDSSYLSASSFNNRTDRTEHDDEVTRDTNPPATAHPRHRSRSRAESKSQGHSRTASRRRSPERDLGRRGRSASRREGLSNRSPESPIPMMPSEEELQTGQLVDPALRFVAQNRQRLHRSSSRPDTSTDRKTPDMRSRNRQPETFDTGVVRRASISTRTERNRLNGPTVDIRPVQSASLGVERISNTSEAERQTYSEVPSFAHLRRRELAQAELEARRLSLTRRPSAPVIPLPGQHTQSTLVTQYAPPLLRAQTDQGPLTSSSFGSQSSLDSPYSRPDSAGAIRSRSQTPRAMKHPAHGQKSIPELPNMTELFGGSITINVPSLPVANSALPKKSRSTSFASPEIPVDMPKHPAFDANIATSRLGGQITNNRGISPSRGVSRERRATQDSKVDLPVLTIGEEEYDGDVVYATSSVIPELQHLAEPPPPPPPPAPPQNSYAYARTTGREAHNNNDYDNILPTNSSSSISQPFYSGNNIANMSSTTNDNRTEQGTNNKELVGKIRNLVGGRIQSTSRGRSASRARENSNKSPNMGMEPIYRPYESVQTPQNAQFSLSTTTGRY